MNMRFCVRVCVFVIAAGTIVVGARQQYAEPTAILARLHAGFLDAQGGRGVLSGDMSLTGFEVRNGKLTAHADVEGALADSTGEILGRVHHDAAMGVFNVASTCNRLSMNTEAVDIFVVGTSVRLEAGTAGFDSRAGGVPKSRDVLCRLSDLLKNKPTPESLSALLNEVVIAIRSAGDTTIRR